MRNSEGNDKNDKNLSNISRHDNDRSYYENYASNYDKTIDNDNIESTDELWDEIGYHKTMAGFWYNIVYTLITIFLSAILMGYLISYFYPFPSSLGIKDMVYGFFALLFLVFDLGTGAVMARFIPEVNINNPKKMLHYIQYFIWYQMITGIIQTTAVSIYALYYATKTNMAYTVWIMLIVSTTQYPGFLGVFRNVLDALQHYEKTRTLAFISGPVIQRITELLFLYLGRIYGENHPEIGPILGIAIGAAIGSYVDDFIATVISAFFFNSVVKPYGIKPIMAFHVEFSWEEIKPVLLFSLKIGLPSLISAPMTFLGLIIYMDYIPQYSTLIFLAVVGGSIGDVLSWFGSAGIGALVAESYMNKKPHLTQYYIGQEVRFNTFIIAFFMPLIILVAQIMPDAWDAMNMAAYAAASAFIIPRLVNYSITRYYNISTSVLTGANQPNASATLGLIKNTGELALKYLYFVVLSLGYRLNLTNTIYLMELGFIPLTILTGFAAFYIIHKKIVKIKIPLKQITIGMIIPAIITYFLLYLVKKIVFDPVLKSHGFFVALIPLLIFIGLILLLGYFPLTGLLGGWDKTNIEEFKKAAKMSGPSKIIVWPIYLMVKKACDISPLHNKFSLETKDVVRSARELLEIKRKNRAALKEELSNSP